MNCDFLAGESIQGKSYGSLGTKEHVLNKRKGSVEHAMDAIDKFMDSMDLDDLETYIPKATNNPYIQRVNENILNRIIDPESTLIGDKFDACFRHCESDATKESVANLRAHFDIAPGKRGLIQLKHHQRRNLLQNSGEILRCSLNYRLRMWIWKSLLKNLSLSLHSTR